MTSLSYRRSRLIDILDAASSWVMTRFWPVYALLIGLSLPAAGYVLGSSLHQPATGLVLAVMIIPCVLRDDLTRALLLVAIVLAAHSCASIYLSMHDPAGASAILSGGRAYWEQTKTWLRTGNDPEYLDLAVWLPQHLTLLAATGLGAGLTLGAGPLVEGVIQVDQMNYYVGRMMAQSDRPMFVLVCGWHAWSIMRGLACTILVFECASWTIRRMTNETAALGERHMARLAVAAALAVADALAKFTTAHVVQQQLNANLWAGFE